MIADPGNVRRHSKKQIAKLAAGISAFGFTNPVQIDENNRVIAGHARLQAAAAVPLDAVPCVRIEGLDEKSRKALAIADIKLGDLSTFDPEMLSAVLAELDGLSFDIELTAFDTAELDILLDGTPPAAAAADPADLLPPVGVRAVTQSRDMWMLGDHRLLCGDALAEGSFEKLRGKERAALVFTDPPCNVPVCHVSPRTSAGSSKARPESCWRG